MQVLANISKHNADLKQELASVIAYKIELEKPAFKSRRMKILKALDKL